MVSLARSRKLALTLFCSLALALLLVQPVAAVNGHPLNVNRHEHAALNRMIKKRADLLGFEPVQNAGGAPSSSSSSSSAAPGPSSSIPSSSSQIPSSSSAPSSSSSAPSSSASSSSSGGLLGGLSSLLAGSSAASSSATPTSSSSSLSSTPSTSATPTSTPTVPSSTDAGTVAGVTITSHVSVPSTSASSNNVAVTPKGSASLSRGATTVLIVIGACVGGGAVLWTIFRKWKLRASSRFEDRLEPINWQPSTGDNGIPGSNRPTSIASSFHSAGHDGLLRSNSGGSYRGNGAYGATGQAPLNPIPDHDFTAGADNLAPGGYADMARGPSPQPQMADLHRGPSLTQHQYDYGAPLHHQGGTTGYPAQGDYYNNAPRY
ncbi:hypothetical protein K488DRAFT_87979 [Vararia minispora EC-137]|uniref:Uncharacterized protein n=1 Tax=Vararia minispora EC-137 TaxID=1314806 RepID=A0ACB8QF22_9AGAM|nr:hypothetical protein K488DRAFT_87979 [Vararia minispora EC-137]